jgi:hypothetical protein
MDPAPGVARIGAAKGERAGKTGGEAARRVGMGKAEDRRNNLANGPGPPTFAPTPCTNV